MAQQRARSGQVVSVLPFAAALPSARTTALLKARQLEIVRIVLHAGESLPAHAVDGEITLQCIEGRLEITTPYEVLCIGPADFIHPKPRRCHVCSRMLIPRE